MQLLRKLKRIEREVVAEKGPFTLFALFMPERELPLWDLVVAAPWASKDEGKALRYMGKKVQSALGSDDLIKLSRIIILDEKNPGLRDVFDSIREDQDVTEIDNREFFGLSMKKGFILTPHEEAA